MVELTEEGLLAFIKMKSKVKLYELERHFNPHSSSEIQDMTLSLLKRKVIKIDKDGCSINQ